MRVVGLITEYNPFHNGHLYHIRKAKELTGADYVVVVMSGNFVQRGAPAVTDKYTRTKMALSCGADLVIELPVCFATQSAETFAYGAVSILDSLGFIDYLCFGSECGDVQILSDIVDVLIEKSNEIDVVINELVKQGFSYPNARMNALLKQFDESNQSSINAILTSSNNILGIEYLKALKKLQSSIKPLTVTRIENSYHDSDINESGISSATSLRNSYRNLSNLSHLKNSLPASVYKLMENAEKQSFPIFENDCSDLLYFCLLRETTESLSSYSDISKDFAQRIIKFLPEYTNFSDFSMLLKTKQYTLTRITRGLCHIILNIKEEFQPAVIPYIRILGLKKDSSLLIKRSKTDPAVPIITKVADAKYQLDSNALITLRQDIYASNLYNRIVYSKFGTKIADEYQHGIILH